MRNEQKARGSPYNARSGYTATYTAVAPQNAVERKETPYTKRPEGSGEPRMDWQEAHEENIIATMALVDALKELSGAIRVLDLKGAK